MQLVAILSTSKTSCREASSAVSAIMLPLRALSRSACCLGLRLDRTSAPASSPTSVALEQATGIATASKWWKGLLDEYGGAATRLATSVGVSQDGEDKEKGGRGVHTGAEAFQPTQPKCMCALIRT